MRPSFNIAGPCVPGEHYMLPPERRLGRAMRLIEDHKYFTLHAGRQTGKTTSAKWLVKHLNATGRFCAMHVDVQNARDTDSPLLAFEVIREDLDFAVQRDLPHVGLGSSQALRVEPSRGFLLRYLRKEASWSEKLFVREVDYEGKHIRIIGC